MLAAAVKHVRETRGGKFRRPILRGWLMREYQLKGAVADGLVLALTRTEAAKNVGKGDFRLVPNAEQLVQHRTWRMGSSQLGLADALHLHTMLDGRPDLTERLAHLRDRVKANLATLGVHTNAGAAAKPKRKGRKRSA